jgi:hypothetical protein
MAVSAMQLWVAGSPVNSGAHRNLPNGSVGLAYDQQITVVGGTPPYNFSLQYLSSIPAGLTLSPSGLVSGTPTNSSFNGHFTIIVTDAAGHYMDARLTLTLLPTVPVPLALTSNTIPDSPIGSNFTIGMYAFGGLPPYTFSIDPSTPLPAGAYLVQGPEASPEWDPDPGYLRTKVQTPGAYSFNLRVTDSAGNQASRAYTFNVPILTANYIYGSSTLGPPPLADEALGVPFSHYLIPLGGTPPYTVTPINIPAGTNLDNTDLFSGTPLEAGLNLPLFYTLADSASHQFVTNGNVSIASSTTPGLALSGGDFGVVQMGSQYASNLFVSGSAQNPPAFTVNLVSGTVPPGLKLLTGPDFNNGGNPTIAAQLAGIPSTPGVYTFAYRVMDGLGQVGERRVTLRVSGMAIVNTGFAPATVGQNYTQTIDVRGGSPPYTFSLITGSLPPGLTFNTSTGTISGIPSSVGSNGVTIQVQDSAGDLLQRGFTLNIYPIQITGPDVLPNGILNENYSYTFVPNPAGSYTFTVSGQPSGLSINSSTGVLSGTLFSSGTFVVNVTAYSASGAVVVRSFTLFVTTLSALNVISGLPTNVISIGGVPTAYLGDFVAGTNLVNILGVNGGTPPYTISLLGGSLPPGLALATAGTYQGSVNFNRWAISGVPTTPGLYTFTLRWADASGISEDRLVAMNITTLGLATAAPSIGYVNQPYSAQLYGAGGTGTYLFALVNFSFLQANLMPPGLTLSPTGQITGTPTSTGVYNPQIQLTSGAVTRRVTLTITINATNDNRRIDFGPGPLLGVSSSGRGGVLSLTPAGVPNTSTGAYNWSLVSGAFPPGDQFLTGTNLPPGFAPPQAVLAGATPTPGTYNFRIRVDDSTGNFGIHDETGIWTAMRVTPINNPYSAANSFPPAQVGTPYSFTLGALNGQAPLTFTTDFGTLLPPGMSFNASGVLSGTPTAGGPFALFYHITDAGGNVRYGSTGLTVFPVGRPIGINTQVGTGTVLISATTNTPYSLNLNDLLLYGYGAAPFTWSFFDGTPPPGLSIVPGVGNASATFSGTPTTPGTYTFSLLTTDVNSSQALIKNLILTVSPLGIFPPTGALPPGVVGTSYSTSVSASGGTPPYTFAKSYDSDMPPGMSMDPTGVLSGTPNLAGPFVLFINATDAMGNTFRQRYTVNVAPAGTVMPALTLTPSSINLSYTIGDPAPAPIPISVVSTSGALSYIAGASGDGTGTWIAISPGTGTTPGSPAATINPVGLSAGTHNGTLTFTSAAASNSPATIPVTVTVSAAIVCKNFSIFPATDTISAAGGPKQFSFGFSTDSSSSCVWSLDTSSLPSWINLTSAASGTGRTGTVMFTVQGNTTAPRIGNININGVSYTLTQFGTACSFTISPMTSAAPSNGGTVNVAVTASASTCGWSTVNNPLYPWITAGAILTAGVPPGSGVQAINVAQNTSASSRSGTIMIAGQAYTVNQAGAGCTFSLSSAGTSFSSAGGSASFNVTAPTGCAWTADTGPSWISGAGPLSGSGNGSVSVNIATNSTTAPRTAAVKVGGQSYSVSQAGLPCSFSLSANNPVQPAGGGGGSVDIVTNAGCGWTASAASTGGWLTPTGTSGTGPTTFGFTAAANGTGASRTGTVTIAGQSMTVTQSGPACAYMLQSSSAAVPGAGGGGSIGVVTAAGCGPYTAVSNAPAWLHITDAGSYTGPASANYSVDANLTGSDRLGTITIAGQTFTVTEPAQPCGVTITSPITSLGEFGGPGQLTYTISPAGCNVSIQSNASWITVTDVSTPGTVKFTAATNTFAAVRSGTVAVGNGSYEVDEAASSCAYTLTSFGFTFGQAGGPGSVPMTYAPSQCGPPLALLADPTGMLTLGTVTPGAGTFTQNYATAIYLSFINYVRTAQIVINGQIYTVKQTSW